MLKLSINCQINIFLIANLGIILGFEEREEGWKEGTEGGSKDLGREEGRTEAREGGRRNERKEGRREEGCF